MASRKDGGASAAPTTPTLSQAELQSCVRRILLARLGLLADNGFYGTLLMHAELGLTASTPVVYTDGANIRFNPSAVAEMTDAELRFVMLHEILHVVLKHCWRGGRPGDVDPDRFNIACDIVVNSTIFDSTGLSPNDVGEHLGGEPMHLVPDGREGCLFTAEEVYEMLEGQPIPREESDAYLFEKDGLSEAGLQVPGSWDDHSHFGEAAGDNDERAQALADEWDQRILDACELIERERAATGLKTCGNLPGFAERLLRDLHRPQNDWRTLLNEFVQEEVCDYSFSPPDRRFADTPFFLPDFNDTDVRVRDILFMVDTSASMSADEVTAAYSEVKGAVDQFDGRLTGWLGFFDAAVYEPIPFVDVDELLAIMPRGGGGTSFTAIFRYVRDRMANGSGWSDEPPAGIVILTDGFAYFPPEKAACGIPVLWVIDNDQVTPPWGKVARIEV